MVVSGKMLVWNESCGLTDLCFFDCLGGIELVCPLISCPLDGSVKVVGKISSIVALFLTQRRHRQPVIQGPNQSCSSCPIFSSSPIVLMAAADALVEMLAAAAQPWPSPADRCTSRCGCAFPSPAAASPVHGVMHRRQESSQPGAHHHRPTQAYRCRMSGLNLRLCVRRVFFWYDSLCRPPQTTRQRRCSGRRCHRGKTMSPRDRRTGGLQVLPDASTNRLSERFLLSIFSFQILAQQNELKPPSS